MALKPLKAVLHLSTTKANANARKLKGEIRGVDRELKGAGGSANASAGRFAAWGAAGVAASAAVVAAIMRVTEAYNNAIRLQDEMSGKAFGVQRQVAGAATQFGLSPSQTVGLLSPITQQAGAGFGDISTLSVAASSAGLVSDPTINQAGQATFGGQGSQILGTMGGFLQRIGEPGLGGPLSKLVRGGLGDQGATQANVRGVLGDILGAFRGSQSANLAQFLQGAQAGTAGLVAQGVSQQRALSIYGGLIKQTATSRQAAEMLRITGEKFFTGDDPKMVAAIDAKLGKGSFFGLKKSDPDRLFGEIIGVLTGTEGQQRAELFKQLGITAEVGGRIANIQATGGAAADVLGRIQGTTGADIEREVGLYRQSGAGQETAQASIAAAEDAGYGTGGKATETLIRRLAEAERKRSKIESPFETFVAESLFYGLDAEQEHFLRQWAKRKLGEEGFDTGAFGAFDIYEGGVRHVGGRVKTERGERALELIREAAGGMSTNQVIINNNGAGSRDTNTNTKADK
ncbi:MAG: hypothetical protein GY788_32355 [bacterium]|nr:hypothetical protein [bacterium]